MGFPPRPCPATQLPVFLVAPERKTAPPICIEFGFHAADLGGEIRPVLRLHPDFFAPIVQLADFASEGAYFLDILHRCAASAFAENFHREFLHEPHRPATSLPHRPRARRGIAHRRSGERHDYVRTPSGFDRHLRRIGKVPSQPRPHAKHRLAAFFVDRGHHALPDQRIHGVVRDDEQPVPRLHRPYRNLKTFHHRHDPARRAAETLHHDHGNSFIVAKIEFPVDAKTGPIISVRRGGPLFYYAAIVSRCDVRMRAKSGWPSCSTTAPRAVPYHDIRPGGKRDTQFRPPWGGR